MSEDTPEYTSQGPIARDTHKLTGDTEVLQFTTKNRNGTATHWMHKSEWDAMKAFEKKQHLRIANGWYNHPKFLERQSRQRHLKYAWIIVGNTRKMVMMETEISFAYKLHGYEATWECWSRYTFERWCTTFDL